MLASITVGAQVVLSHLVPLRQHVRLAKPVSLVMALPARFALRTRMRPPVLQLAHARLAQRVLLGTSLVVQLRAIVQHALSVTFLLLVVLA